MEIFPRTQMCQSQEGEESERRGEIGNKGPFPRTRRLGASGPTPARRWTPKLQLSAAAWDRSNTSFPQNQKKKKKSVKSIIPEPHPFPSAYARTLPVFMPGF